VKIILVGVAFAALMVLPLSAPLQATEGLSHSRAHPEQKKRLWAAYRDLNGSAWNSIQPTSNASPTDQGLCSTAPSFCADYHGSNGG
jgi:hypothetical protein